MACVPLNRFSKFETELWGPGEGSEIIPESIQNKRKEILQDKDSENLHWGCLDINVRRLNPRTHNMQLSTWATIVILYAPSLKIQTVFSYMYEH